GILAGAVCIIELTGLKGRDRLDCPVKALQSYEF
ncbi:MAG TPA: adenine phosphoribosyltransferase, partial [Alphaproteobacteria bacterium]|nr:adenine phosphoribosyltransferase [Alphaproteobacteria bacterium]